MPFCVGHSRGSHDTTSFLGCIYILLCGLLRMAHLCLSQLKGSKVFGV